MTIKHITIIGIIAIILFYTPVLILSADTMHLLTSEDGFYEYLGALFFLFASVGFLFTLLKAKKRNIFYLLFALAFLFAAGEEISWGQRILNFDTPPAIGANNAQKEFNLHNLNFVQHEHGLGSSIKGMLLNFNRLFILFWMTYCILLPIANRYSNKLRALFSRIRLPIISIWFGMLFLVNEITSKTLELFVITCQDNCPPIYEIKESLWAVLVFLMAVYFFSLESSPEEVDLPVCFDSSQPGL